MKKTLLKKTLERDDADVWDLLELTLLLLLLPPMS